MRTHRTPTGAYGAVMTALAEHALEVTFGAAWRDLEDGREALILDLLDASEAEGLTASELSDRIGGPANLASYAATLVAGEPELIDDERAVALANALSIDIADVEETPYGEGRAYDAEGGEYMVLTDVEADEMAADYIADTLWAFNPSFLTGYGAFVELEPEDIERLRGDRCEGINGAFRRMVGDDLEELIRDAIAADGRGHFLSCYDGEELEEGDWFIYRTN